MNTRAATFILQLQYISNIYYGNNDDIIWLLGHNLQIAFGNY